VVSLCANDPKKQKFSHVDCDNCVCRIWRLGYPRGGFTVDGGISL
jgi:hypothetical protein